MELVCLQHPSGARLHRVPTYFENDTKRLQRNSKIKE